MNWSSGITEASIFIAFSFGILNAAAQGRRWLFTLLWGAVAGFVAEVFIVSRDNPRYCYGLDQFAVKAWHVPVCIGLGWGLVFYVAGWTAQRLRFKRPVASAFMAGLLGVNLDLSFDPVANLHGFWNWYPIVPGQAPVRCSDRVPGQELYAHATGHELDGTLFQVPFDNFIAWVAIIGIYTFFVRYTFRHVNHYDFRKKKGPPGGAALASDSPWWDVFLPLVATVPAAGIFVLVRQLAPKIYHLPLFGHSAYGGEGWIFTLIFVVGTIGFWVAVVKSRRDDQPNRFVLGTVVYFHLLSFMLFVLGGGLVRPHAALSVMIPVNLVAGLLAYSWPYLDSLLERAPRPAGDEFRMPSLTYRTLANYSGETVRALYCAPASEHQLKAVLEYAREHGKRVTFRAGGQAFDSQSLNDQIVVSLERFKSIKVDEANKTVTVGCGQTWGSILKETLKHDLAPYIMVTNSAATAGGTLSSHSMSRFSPTQGREGEYVESFELLTPGGRRLRCSDSENPDLFHGVIGGLGYLGAVLEVTYKLRPVPHDPVVKSTYTCVNGLARIAKGARPSAPHQHWSSSLVECALAQRSERLKRANANGGAPAGAEAFSAAVNMRGGVWGLIAESEYVAKTDAPGGKLKPSFFHTPRSLGHLVLQLLAWIPVLRGLGYHITYRWIYGEKPTIYFDEVFGYTFFEDGHKRSRKILQALGFPCRIIQQTYMLPVSEGAQHVGQALAKFLADADQYLDYLGLDPAFIDVLYVGSDSKTFPLSSSNGLDAFAVSITFERVIRRLDREAAALAELSVRCDKLGGRVHLVKNVFADQNLIGATYAGGLATMKNIRAKRLAAGVVYNGFAERLLPGLD